MLLLVGPALVLVLPVILKLFDISPVAMVLLGSVMAIYPVPAVHVVL